MLYITLKEISVAFVVDGNIRIIPVVLIEVFVASFAPVICILHNCKMNKHRVYHCKKSTTSSNSRSLACFWAQRDSATFTLTTHLSCAKRIPQVFLFAIDVFDLGALLLPLLLLTLRCLASERGWDFVAGHVLPPGGNGGSLTYFFKQPCNFQH